jgi:hypothetical protein
MLRNIQEDLSDQIPEVEEEEGSEGVLEIEEKLLQAKIKLLKIQKKKKMNQQNNQMFSDRVLKKKPTM